MTLLGTDVSRYQLPAALPWRAWVAGGLRVMLAQMTHGEDDEPHGEEHLAQAIAAGVPCVGIYHYLLHGNIEEQILAFTSWVGYHGVTFAALDVESPGLTAADVSLFCGLWEDKGASLPLLLYGNYSGLVPILNAHPELKRYGIWWAQYSAAETPPAGLRVVGWQKLGSTPGFVGHLAPYAGAIDITEWFEWPDGRTTMPKVMVPHGSLVGIHAINPDITQQLVEEAVAAGAPYAAVKILNDAEALAKVKRASPTTWTYLRYYNPDDDSLQGLDDWTTTQRGEWCDRVLHKIYSQITAEQCKWVDWACAWNEEDPPGPFGYRDLGETFLMLIEKNEARRAAGLPYVKLALGCLAQGTPELWEIDQLVDTGLYKRMHDLFYSWDGHEGAFAWQRITEGYQSKMPSTPAIAALGPGHGDVAPWPGSGSGSFRFVWTFERRLRPLGQLVPLLIGEFYPGVPGELERYNWYDDHACVYEYLTGFALYNLGPTKDWPDLTADYLALRQHRIDIRNRVNGGLMPNVTDADLAQLLTNNQNDAVILAKYAPAPLWKVGDVALAVANPLQLFDVSHNPSGAPRPNVTYDIDVAAVSADGLWLRVSPVLWVRVSDVRHK